MVNGLCRAVGVAAWQQMMPTPRAITVMLMFVLLGCTPVGYIKSGATDEQVRQDLTDCTEIARHQAFRDQPSLQFQLGLGYGLAHRRDRFAFPPHRPSYAELQHRYRRVCMVARGYELALLEDQE